MLNDPLSCSGALYIKQLILNLKIFLGAKIFIGISRKKKLDKSKISMVYKYFENLIINI
jgi:hypothetical protein